MLIPYSTDAPIYYFPWMTICLIVANCITFAVTGMGWESEGWLLTYGHGLHPLEWVAYNFLHFGIFHLIGNMFFLWAFGIVVEGKLGWWKFLLVYLGIGILGGALIQIAMLGYVPKDPFVLYEPPPNQGWLFSENTLSAQERDFDDDDVVIPNMPVNNMPGDNIPNPDGAFDNLEEDDGPEIANDPHALFIKKPGAGGASLIIYGLMAIVLVWAPRNEIHCAWIGLRSGTFEVEYIYFCGFYIVTEVLSAAFSVRGFEVTSEIGHATGALIGFGLGSLFVKLDWVDCENWDLYSVMQNKHSAAVGVGEWQNTYAVPRTKRGADEQALNNPDSDGAWPSSKKKKKKSKPKPKLVELQSFDDDFDDSFDDAGEEETVIVHKAPTEKHPAKAKTSTKPPPPPAKTIRREVDFAKELKADSVKRIADLAAAGNYKAATREYLGQQANDAEWKLPEEDLRQLADGAFKAKAIQEASVLLNEFIRIYPANADRQRIKLGVLYVRYQQRPTAALKMLAKMDGKSLPDDYRSICQKAMRDAQKMISDGVVDVES